MLVWPKWANSIDGWEEISPLNCFSSPAKVLSKVDLPLPFLPIIPRHSPRLMLKDISLAGGALLIAGLYKDNG